ncbi:thermonuclease [Dissulfurispira thermophila]|uniref:Thermonuclease n=2 Tax=root TaxID=1 RepID=A0A7G1H4Q9_9BACT|nr:thermonuclease family protein [Dissulfurispira thermophila]BCB97141.1 thermonuclease [Dissulfurispira thermophila]
MQLFYYTRFLATITLILFITSPINTAYGEKFRVTAVHDGDTISIRTRSFAGIPLKTEQVRLIGIDAPELKQEPWGRMSKRYLKKLISESDWVVNIEFDVEPRDRYNRLLCYIWDKKGQLINEKMLENGYAVLYTVPPNVKYTNRFIEAQKKAQIRKIGIWRKGGLKESPEQWRKEHPRN